MPREAHDYAAADERRRRYDAVTRDKEANQRARQEFAEISRRQLSRPAVTVDLDDAAPEQRRAWNHALQTQPDQERSDAAEDMTLDLGQRRSGPPAAPAADASTSRTSAAREASAGAKPPADESEQPAQTEQPRPKSTRAPESTAALATIAESERGSRGQQASTGLFVVVERDPAPASHRRAAAPPAYAFDDHPGGAVFEDYLPVPRLNLLACAIVAIVSILTIYWFWQTPQVRIYAGKLGIGESVENTTIAAPVDPPGEHSVVGGPTIAPEQVDAVLAKYGSPAAGTGRIWVELGKQYGIDPAYALAFFIHESSAGTNPGWAGLKPGGGSTYNIGNIICAGYASCYGRFRDYGSWEAGIEDWYKLISNEYIGGRGAKTIEQIIPIYAPASDNNDVANYIQSVVGLVSSWRQGIIQ